MENKYEQGTGNDNYEKYFSEKSLKEKISNVAIRAGSEVIKKVLILYYCFLDPDTPKQSKAMILGSLGYFILPLDAIPDVTPVLGFSDDLGALAIAFATVLAHIKPIHKEHAQQKLESIFNKTNSV